MSVVVLRCVRRQFFISLLLRPMCIYCRLFCAPVFSSDVMQCVDTVYICQCVLHSQVVVGPLEQRGFTVDAVDILLDSTNTQLPLSSDCVDLAGSTLLVRGTPVFPVALQDWVVVVMSVMVKSQNHVSC